MLLFLDWSAGGHGFNVSRHLVELIFAVALEAAALSMFPRMQWTRLPKLGDPGSWTFEDIATLFLPHVLLSTSFTQSLRVFYCFKALAEPSDCFCFDWILLTSVRGPSRVR
jgi:hypothetical protein